MTMKIYTIDTDHWQVVPRALSEEMLVEMEDLYESANEQWRVVLSLAPEPPAQQPMSRDREVWRAALTLANNICVQESDRYNGDDAAQEASAAGYCARRICDWIAPPDVQLAELLEEAGIGKGESK